MYHREKVRMDHGLMEYTRLELPCISILNVCMFTLLLSFFHSFLHLIDYQDVTDYYST